MRKIPTIYKRDEHNPSRVDLTRQVVDVSECTPTGKWDGTAVLFGDGIWWARRMVKPNGRVPEGFELAEEDQTTGKRFGWVPIDDDPQWKHHHAAIDDTIAEDGQTFEAVGPHFQGNPHGLAEDELRLHGSSHIIGRDLALADLVASRPDFEGIVWWSATAAVGKLKRRDLGLLWPFSAPKEGT